MAGWKPTNPTFVGGVNRANLKFEEAVPFPFCSSASGLKTVTKAQFDAGQTAVALHSQATRASGGSKIISGNNGAVAEILGQLRFVSAEQFAAIDTSRYLSKWGLVDVAAPGKVHYFKYDSNDAPALKQRVVINSEATAIGKVRVAIQQAYPQDSVISAAPAISIVPNIVVDLDTVNYECGVLYLPGGAS